MLLKSKRKYLGLFFVTAFLLLKVVNLHAFEHHLNQGDFEEDCELCEFFYTNSNANPATFSPEPVEINIPIIYTFRKENTVIDTPVISIPYCGYFFNKPPPFIS